MGRVMVWGQPGDTPFEAVRGELARRNVAQLVLEQERVLEMSCALDVGARAEGTIELAGEVVALAEIDAVYARPYESWRVLGRAGYAPMSDEGRHAAALDQTLFAWLDITDALVINRPSAMASNGSKPYQAELIRAQGFAVPETLVTTDPDAAREFVARHGAVVYKSVSSVRSIVSRITEEAMARMDDVAWCPTQFQARVPGVDYRVHAVGGRTFACEIRSQADDYRYASRRSTPVEMAPAELPGDVAERCVALGRSLGLALAGIDLRRTPEGEWYCFEVNPSPGFTYYEQAAGQPIAAAVADLLTRQ